MRPAVHYREVARIAPGHKLIRWGAAIGLPTALAATLYWINPVEIAWLPKCPLHQLTGWHCPGCGITRAAHALLHGDLSAALAMNPLVVVAGPLLIVYCIFLRLRHGPGWSTHISPRTIAIIMAIVIGFGVLRNVPVYPLMLLAPGGGI